jgi:hypothetical protein
MNVIECYSECDVVCECVEYRVSVLTWHTAEKMPGPPVDNSVDSCLLNVHLNMLDKSINVWLNRDIKKGKLMNNKICFLCYTPGQPDVPAVEMSPYGYAVCASHYASDFDEFVSDYS